MRGGAHVTLTTWLENHQESPSLIPRDRAETQGETGEGRSARAEMSEGLIRSGVYRGLFGGKGEPQVSRKREAVTMGSSLQETNWKRTQIDTKKQKRETPKKREENQVRTGYNCPP